MILYLQGKTFPLFLFLTLLCSAVYCETIPFSNKRFLVENDLANFSKERLRIARNEIFARHGYAFKSRDLSEHFSQYDWYTPKTKKVNLSDVETANVSFIRKYETSYDLLKRLQNLNVASKANETDKKEIVEKNQSSVFGDVIKACSINWFSTTLENGIEVEKNWFRWDERSDKPYGIYVELALSIAKKLNMELEILRRESIKDCFQLMRTGEVDFMLELLDKDDRREYMKLFEIVKFKNGSSYVGLSKKSKFISRINDFQNAIPRSKEYIKINNFDRKYESVADNSWDTYRHAKGYASGELKHEPKAFIDKNIVTQSAKKNQKVCIKPPRGTLTSALCFLVEKHTELFTKLDSVDEKNCTFRSQGQTIYLNRVDPKNIQYKMGNRLLCWILNGQNITSGGWSRYTVCGQNIDTARLDKAFGAIYGKYCTGVDEEF